MRAAHDAIYAKDKNREEAAANKAERAGRSPGLCTSETKPEGSGRGSTASPTERSSLFAPQTRVGAQPSIKSVI